MKDYCQIADAFEADILSGRHPCSRVTRLAFERNATMRARPPTGYRFDSAKAAWLCAFVEALTYPSDLAGRNINLLPWQVWLLATMEGWRNASTGAPMFRRDIVFITKSHGKGLLLAAMGLAELAHGGQSDLVLSAGTTRDQAQDCFEMARTMVESDPTGALSRDFGLVASKYVIEGRGDARKFRTVSSEGRGVAGKPPKLTIVDELAQHANRDIYDQIFPSLVKRSDSRVVMLSNAGFDQSDESPGWEAYQQARRVLEGKEEDESVFAFLLEADPDLDAWAESTWRQCNWNIGNGVDLAALRAEARAARASPQLRGIFQTMHLGWWAASARAFVEPEKWAALGTAPTIEATKADPAWGNAKWWMGLDLAFGGTTGTDLAALAVVAARLDDQGEREYRAWVPRQWLNEESATLETTPILRKWADDGLLTLTPGSTIPFDTQVQGVTDVAETLPAVEAVVVGKSWANPMMEALSDDGLTVVPLEESHPSLNFATTKLGEAIALGRFTHDGSPLLAWQAGNAEVRANTKSEIKLYKAARQETRKKDAMDAIVDAMSQAALQDLDLPPDPNAPPKAPVPQVIHLPSPVFLAGRDDSDDW